MMTGVGGGGSIDGFELISGLMDRSLYQRGQETEQLIKTEQWTNIWMDGWKDGGREGEREARRGRYREKGMGKKGWMIWID